MKLLLTRHGQTPNNIRNCYTGEMDVPLTELGISQAHELAKRLKGTPFDAIITSPLTRAIQTAAVVAEAFPSVPVYVFEEFAELRVGVLQGLTREEAAEQYPEDLAATLTLNEKPRNGESIQAAANRWDKALERLRKVFPSDAAVLVVSHSFAASCIIAVSRNLPFSEWGRFTPGNCEIAELEI
jgi:probable phosphoglycerate mutase